MSRNIDAAADSKDNFGRTPLSWAAQGRHRVRYRLMKLLVERDDVVADLKDEDGRTLLLWAAQERARRGGIAAQVEIFLGSLTIHKSTSLPANTSLTVLFILPLVVPVCISMEEPNSDMGRGTS
jgi:ankyrin repeat protein